MAYLLCFIAISKSPVWWCSRKKIRWNQHDELDVHITSQPSHQPQPEEGLWLWRCEGREQQSFYSLNEWLFFARMFSSLIYFLTWSKIHSSSSLLPDHIHVTLHSFPHISSALESFTCAVVIVKVLTVSVWKLFCLHINRSFCRELTIHTCILRNCRTIQASKIMRSRIVDQRTLLFGWSLISQPL